MQFQVKLFEASGQIEIHVRTAGVQSHTVAVGIQDHTRRVGLTYRSGRFSLANTAIRFGHNSPPQLTRIDPIQIYPGQRTQFIMTVTETDGDEVDLVATGLPDGSVFNRTNGKFRWTPTPDAVGDHELRFTATEVRNDAQQPLSDESVVSIQVLGLNQPPIITSQAPTEVVQGEVLAYSVAGSDPDSEGALTCRLSEAPAGAEMDGCDLSWSAAAPPGTEVPFRVSLRDVEGASGSQSFTVRVVPNPGAPTPVIAAPPTEVPPGWLRLDGSGSDLGAAANPVYSWRAISWPDPGQMPMMEATNEAIARVLLTYRGVYRFSLQIDGEVLQSASAEVSVAVVNVPPVAIVSEDATYSLRSGDELDIELSGASSVDPNPEDAITCSWEQVQGPSLTLRPSGRDLALTITEPAVYQLSLVCSDGLLDSEPALVTLTVDDGSPPPRPTRPTPPSGCGCFHAAGGEALLLLFGFALIGRRRRAFRGR